MAALGWGAAALLSVSGALFYWGADILGIGAFYRLACLFLAAAVLAAVLASLGVW